MFNNKRMLALDLGASKLVLAEFVVLKDGELELMNYAIGVLPAGADGETDSSSYIVSTLRQLMREHGIRPAPLYMSISGQAVFPRFVKLPPVARDKIMQIVRYEAEQNVPFPIEEVVWDYRLLTGEEGDDVNVMLVAVKTDSVVRMTDCVVAAGVEPEVVDVAPMALYNAVRCNYPDLEGCAMVLDVGARCSNLIFMEGQRVFSRSIPVAGNTITQEIAKEFGVSTEEAEKLKREHAFIAFGGVYAAADDEVADRVSKVARNVITRLHAEVNRSINFYRGQQGGSAPSLILLTGGSSMIPHTDTFFREKLKVDVDYLNPFLNVSVSEEIPTERVESDIHLLGEVVGLAVRRSSDCVMEINLMPPELVSRKIMRKRQPFFAAAGVALVLIMLCWWYYSQKMRTVWEGRIGKLELQLDIREDTDEELKDATVKEGVARNRHDAMVAIVQQRAQWVDWMKGIQECMLEGMWLRAMMPVERAGKTWIQITGRAFEDSAAQYETADATAVEVFRNRLRQHSQFSEETRITASPVSPPGAYARDFTIMIAPKGKSAKPAEGGAQ